MTIDVQLALSLADGNTGKFPQAKVYDSAGALSATVDLSHVADGWYHALHAFAAAGNYAALYTVYDDSGHTVVSGYDPVSERVEVAADPSLLAMNLSDGATDKFPQASVYDEDGSLITTVNLSHVASGLYTAAYNFPTVGHYTLVYISYDDAGHTTKSSGVDVVSERVRVVRAGAEGIVVVTVEAEGEVA